MSFGRRKPHQTRVPKYIKRLEALMRRWDRRAARLHNKQSAIQDCVRELKMVLRS